MDSPITAVKLTAPEPGSIWTHKKGTRYLALEVSSSADDGKDDDFPVTVHYMGPDGRIWPRTLPRWHAGMTFYKAPRFKPDTLLSRLYLATLVWWTRRHPKA